jgi:CheY-like chemotaxis protein
VVIIQIVDDNPDIRETIKSVLGRLAAEFVESGDGDEAVRHFAEHKPDLVTMDLRMGHTDGIAAVRSIRRLSERARVIIVTQYDNDDLRSAAMNAGAEGYILKDDLSRLLDFVPSA